MSGWGGVGQALGTLFGGGQARDEAVYRDQLGQNASLEQKLAVANRERMKSMALDAVLNDESIPQQQRNILAAELGSQFSGLQQGLLRQQEQGFRNDALTRADAAGYGVNAPLMALAKGPVELNKALAGGLMQGNTYLPGADLAPTELGLAEMFADQARGNASNAAAGASAARAEASREQAELTAARRERPELYRAPPRGASTDGGPSPDDVLDVVALNEAIRAENRRLTREGKPTLPEIPLDGLVRGFMAPPATPAPLRATNPQTGEVLELRGGQWVKAQ